MKKVAHGLISLLTSLQTSDLGLIPFSSFWMIFQLLMNFSQNHHISMKFPHLWHLCLIIHFSIDGAPFVIFFSFI